MTFKLSERSKGRLAGVHPTLVKCVERAIELTKVDFGVVYGLRTEEEQRRLVDAGKSQTMKSYHLRQPDGYGHAVDLMAYVDGNASWELNLYDDIADAMKKAAREVNAHIRWGAAWQIDDIRVWSGTMEQAMMAYIDLRRSEGKRPFIDGPHFELR